MITALHSAYDVGDLQQWTSTYELTHLVGLDENREVVWPLYAALSGRPQYAVVDRGFNLVLQTRSRGEAETLVEELLAQP